MPKSARIFELSKRQQEEVKNGNRTDFLDKFLEDYSSGLISLILTAGGCTAYQSKLVAEAIDNGAHPIEARCGIVSSAMSECAIRAAK